MPGNQVRQLGSTFKVKSTLNGLLCDAGLRLSGLLLQVLKCGVSPVQEGLKVASPPLANVSEKDKRLPIFVIELSRGSGHSFLEASDQRVCLSRVADKHATVGALSHLGVVGPFVAPDELASMDLLKIQGVPGRGHSNVKGPLVQQIGHTYTSKGGVTVN